MTSPTPTTPTTYRIAEVAARSGFTPATLRYYEDRGLVRPSRSEAGYRIYDDRALQRLRFIARAKELGCSLDEIADLAGVWDGGRCVHVQQRLRATVEARVAASQRQIAELTRLTADLQRAAAALAADPTPGPCSDTCACMATPSVGAGDHPGTAPTAIPPHPAGDEHRGAGAGCDCTTGDAATETPATGRAPATARPQATPHDPPGAGAGCDCTTGDAATENPATAESQATPDDRPGAGAWCDCTAGDDDAETPATGPRAVAVPLLGGGDDRSDAEEPAIACTLDGGQMGARVDAWAGLLGPPDSEDPGGVVAREAIDGGVRLTFGPGADVAEVARLAAAEQDCCRFFRFALSIDARGLALEVRAPDGAADVVTALFGAPA